MNLGIFICTKCSGTHRSMGTDISKVQSVYYDTETWKNQKKVDFFKTHGNKKKNNELLKYIPDYYETPKDTPYLRTWFIPKKYIAELFTKKGILSHKMPQKIICRKFEDEKQKNKSLFFELVRNSVNCYAAELDSRPLKTINVCDTKVKIDESENRKGIVLIMDDWVLWSSKAEDVVEFTHAIRRAQYFYRKNAPIHKKIQSGDVDISSALDLGLADKQKPGGFFHNLMWDKRRWFLSKANVLYYFTQKEYMKCEKENQKTLQSSGGIDLLHAELEFTTKGKTKNFA
eukprot:UN33430